MGGEFQKALILKNIEGNSLIWPIGGCSMNITKNGIIMELRREYKTQYVISQLNKGGIYENEKGVRLHDLDYRSLIYLLAMKRVADS